MPFQVSMFSFTILSHILLPQVWLCQTPLRMTSSARRVTLSPSDAGSGVATPSGEVCVRCGKKWNII